MTKRATRELTRERGRRCAGARRFLTWRNVLGAGVAAVRDLGCRRHGLVAHDRPFRRRGGRSAGLDVSPSVVAVLPFSVRGSCRVRPPRRRHGQPPWHQAGRSRRPEERRFARAPEPHQPGRRADGRSGARCARSPRRFGAGLFVMGDVVEAGGRLQVTAALYRTRRMDERRQRGIRRGRRHVRPRRRRCNTAPRRGRGRARGAGAEDRGRDDLLAAGVSSLPGGRSRVPHLRLPDGVRGVPASGSPGYALCHGLLPPERGRRVADSSRRGAGSGRDRPFVMPAASRTGTASCSRHSGRGAGESTPKPSGATGRSSAPIRRMWRRGSSSGRC